VGTVGVLADFAAVLAGPERDSASQSPVAVALTNMSGGGTSDWCECAACCLRCGSLKRCAPARLCSGRFATRFALCLNKRAQSRRNVHKQIRGTVRVTRNLVLADAYLVT
jgi:hypothetical protein